MFAPRLIVLADESLTGPDLERVQDRLNLWLRHHINTVLEPVLQLEAPADLEGAARGLAYRLYENLGLMPRRPWPKRSRASTRTCAPSCASSASSSAPTTSTCRWPEAGAARTGADPLCAEEWRRAPAGRQPSCRTSCSRAEPRSRSIPEISTKLYEVAGFKVAGKRAVRVDILERLADIIRPLIALDAKTHQGELPAGAAEGNGFRVTVEMTSLLGTAGEDFASILTSLGYRVRRTPKVAAPVEAASRDAADAVADDAEATRSRRRRPRPLRAADDGRCRDQRSRDGCRRGRGADRRRRRRRRGRGRDGDRRSRRSPPHPRPPSRAKPPSPSSTKSGSPAAAVPTIRGTTSASATSVRPRRGAPPGAEGAAAPRRSVSRERPKHVPPRPTATRPQGRPVRASTAAPARQATATASPAASPSSAASATTSRARTGKSIGRARSANVPLDPDSPWAALAALRNPKQE